MSVLSIMVKHYTRIKILIKLFSPQQPQPAPLEEAQATSGFKPINYAAAAKANKPKKPPTTATATATAATTPAEKPLPKVEKPKATEKVEKKEKPKTEKVNVQRKNSTK